MEFGDLATWASAFLALVFGVMTYRETRRANQLQQEIERRAARERRSKFSMRDHTWLQGKIDNYEGLLRRLVGLDYTCVEAHLSERAEGTVARWWPLFEYSPETWRLLIFEDKVIVGYWSAFALTEEAFDRVKHAELPESELTVEHLEKVEGRGRYRLFFSMVCVHPEFRDWGGENVYALLKADFKKWLASLRLGGSELLEIAAYEASPAGGLIASSNNVKPIAAKHLTRALGDAGRVLYCRGEDFRLGGAPTSRAAPQAPVEPMT